MIVRRTAWTCWALLPIFGLAFHFGPGQKLYHRDNASRALSRANAAQQKATEAQTAAYAQHLKGIEARRAAFLSQSAEDAAKSKAVGAQEEAAYEAAAVAWKSAAEAYQRVQDTLAGGSWEIAERVRWSRARALIHAGQIGTGVDELEEMLDKLTNEGRADSELARKCREEAATGYYYGARLMRLSGRPAVEWKEVSGRARQNFRYLAETSGAASSVAKNHQNNLELVLNLEQSSIEDIQAKPLPKDSPRANRDGLGPAQGKRRSQRPPRRGPPNNGASGVGEIESGW